MVLAGKVGLPSIGSMQNATGISTTIAIEPAEGETYEIEVALGPSDTLGDLEDALARFAEAYCLSVDAEAFTMRQIRFCLFDPWQMIIAFDEDDDGVPDPNSALSNRFAFLFLASAGEEYTLLDPWLVVRPCTLGQVDIWEELMAMNDEYTVQTVCLDDRLRQRFEDSGQVQAVE
jgi:hypothetical protein